MWWQYYYIAIGFYWHELTELALSQSRNDNCFDCSLESCQNLSVPRQQSTEANAWPSRKSMGIQPLSRLYKNPLIVFCGNYSCCEWIEVLQIIQLVATLTARGENSTCTWADWIPTACCWGAIHKRVWSVFGSPFFRKRMSVVMLPVGKQALVANKHYRL